jgi:hypothetical protein
MGGQDRIEAVLVRCRRAAAPDRLAAAAACRSAVARAVGRVDAGSLHSESRQHVSIWEKPVGSTSPA